VLLALLLIHVFESLVHFLLGSLLHAHVGPIMPLNEVQRKTLRDVLKLTGDEILETGRVDLLRRCTVGRDQVPCTRKYRERA
jgi:hypothetical protein